MIENEKVYREQFIALFGDRLPKEEEEEVHTSLKEQTEALRRAKEEKANNGFMPDLGGADLAPGENNQE